MAATGILLVATMLLAGSEWGLAEGGEIYLQFGDGRVSGTGGCNRFSGSYAQNGSQLHIDQVVATQMACGDARVMQAEQQFFQWLATVRHADATHMKLILKDASGTTIATLIRRDWD